MIQKINKQQFLALFLLIACVKLFSDITYCQAHVFFEFSLLDEVVQLRILDIEYKVFALSDENLDLHLYIVSIVQGLF